MAAIGRTKSGSGTRAVQAFKDATTPLLLLLLLLLVLVLLVVGRLLTVGGIDTAVDGVGVGGSAGTTGNVFGTGIGLDSWGVDDFDSVVGVLSRSFSDSLGEVIISLANSFVVGTRSFVVGSGVVVPGFVFCSDDDLGGGVTSLVGSFVGSFVEIGSLDSVVDFTSLTGSMVFVVEVGGGGGGGGVSGTGSLDGTGTGVGVGITFSGTIVVSVTDSMDLDDSMAGTSVVGIVVVSFVVFGVGSGVVTNEDDFGVAGVGSTGSGVGAGVRVGVVVTTDSGVVGSGDGGFVPKLNNGAGLVVSTSSDVLGVVVSSSMISSASLTSSSYVLSGIGKPRNGNGIPIFPAAKSCGRTCSLVDENDDDDDDVVMDVDRSYSPLYFGDGTTIHPAKPSTT